MDNKFLLLPEEDTGIYVQPVSVAIAWAEPSITDFQPLLGHEEASTGLRFSLIRKLGCGSQGFVLLMRDERRGELVAIKYCSKDIPNKSRAKYMAREVLNHQELSLFAHPHIVQLYEVFLTSRYVAMAMEYVDGVDLYSYLNANGGRLSENEARAIFQQLILAVDFCHRIGKGHRDIKLSNVSISLLFYRTGHPLD